MGDLPGVGVEGGSQLEVAVALQDQWWACTFASGLLKAIDCQGTCCCTHQLPWIVLGIVGDTPLGVRFAVDLMLSCQAAAWLLLWVGDIGLRMLH